MRSEFMSKLGVNLFLCGEYEVKNKTTRKHNNKTHH